MDSQENPLHYDMGSILKYLFASDLNVVKSPVTQVLTA